MDDLAARRAEAVRRRELTLAYKGEIYDWWDFENAISEACRKTGATDAEMRSIACDPGVWT